jgi:hypothetical protein
MIRTQYVKDSFSVELKAIILAVTKFSSKKDVEENVRFLQKGYQSAKVQRLSDQEWSKMQNTESWKITTVEKMIPAVKKVKNNLLTNDVLGEIFTEFATQKVRAPIAIRLADKSLYLVSGNIRLMAARVLGFQPSIVIVNTPWS